VSDETLGTPVSNAHGDPGDYAWLVMATGWEYNDNTYDAQGGSPVLVLDFEDAAREAAFERTCVLLSEETSPLRWHGYNVGDGGDWDGREEELEPILAMWQADDPATAPESVKVWYEDQYLEMAPYVPQVRDAERTKGLNQYTRVKPKLRADFYKALATFVGHLFYEVVKVRRG
jgi:hypothetical protein